MTDHEFVQAFFAGSLPPTQFHHRDHLRLAWLLCRELGAEAAGTRIGAGIRHFAASHGQSTKYHETMTRFWVWIVDHMARSRPDIMTFEAFLAAFPTLLDTNLPYHHWRPETMGGTAARSRWIEPDLRPLPA